MNKKIFLLHLIEPVLSITFTGVLLFWLAGRVDWWPAWAVILIWTGFYAAMDIFVLRSNPELMEERLHPPRSAKSWDRLIMSLLRLAQLARYILAGLDQQRGWTTGFPLSAQIAALAVCILGDALFIWAMASNAFFSQIVRVQADRGHAVATSGPYRYVRHPGYVGLILFDVALSVMLASWPAIVAGGVCAALIIVRTSLEDRTLQAELPGYADYSHQVRYRLLPGVW